MGVTGYIVNGTRPDGSFSYKTHASFNGCYGEKHWSSLNEFISYLWRTGGDNSKLLAAGENNFAVSAMQIGTVQPAIVAQLAGSYSMVPIRSHGSQGLKSAQ